MWNAEDGGQNVGCGVTVGSAEWECPWGVRTQNLEWEYGVRGDRRECVVGWESECGDAE